MYPHLFSPIRIGGLELRNRIAMAPMGVEIIDGDGRVRDRVVRYYEERARGGAGLVITEVCAVSYPRGATSTHQIAISDDDCLPGLHRLTERVKAHGACIAAQLVHHGKVARVDTQQGRPLLVPSEPSFHGAMDLLADLSQDEIGLLIRASGGQPKYRVATREDIEEVVESFAAAALRARAAGFDAVEIHAAHGYLISSFLSAAWNTRTDAYGGGIEGRARLLVEVLRAAKRRAGADFPIWCRLDAVEYRTPNGIRLEDAIHAAGLAVDAGADAIHVSAYADATSGPGFTEGTLVDEEARHVEHAARIKAGVDVPVIAVGRIEPDVAEAIVREGKADVVAMARKMLADAHIARKLQAGRIEAVRPCIYSYTCVAQPFFDRRVRCSVNPVTANEIDLADRLRQHAPETRRVVIAGGGPAGLEAARVAARRGHDVTLFEQSDQLGGSLRLAAVVDPPKARLLDWLEAQVIAYDVELRLGEVFDAAHARTLEADHVIVAVGARRVRPRLPGIELDHVFTGDRLAASLIDANDDGVAERPSLVDRWARRARRTFGATADPAPGGDRAGYALPVGERVVVIGGGLIGIELARYYQRRGRRVTVLDEGRVLAAEMAHPRRWRVLHDLREGGATLVRSARVRAITPDAVHYHVGQSDQAGGTAGTGGADDAIQVVPADTVVVTTGLEPNLVLADALRAAGIQPIPIGDASGLGYIEGAIHDGFHAAIGLGEVPSSR